MIVLGLSAYYHDSAAAIIDGSGIIAAAQEERFSRQKGDWHFPQNSMQFCIDQLGSGKRPDLVAFYENPQLKAKRIINEAAATSPKGSEIWPETLRSLSLLNHTLPQKLLQVCADPEHVRFVSHHRSHAASAYFPSPFNHAAILVADGVGEWSTTTIWQGVGNDLTPIYEVKYPHSLGLFYSAFTQYCGFKVNSGEYKLMGLAPFGSSIYKTKILENLINLRADGSFELNLRYFGFRHSKSTICSAFEDLFEAPARKADTLLDKHTMDIAASAQAVIELCMLKLAQTAMRVTGSKNLCLAGGVALNCVSNTGLVRKLQNLNDIWIQPAAGDAGGALGAALQVRVSEVAERPSSAGKDAMKESLLGPSYATSEIKDALIKRGLVYTSFKSESKLCEGVAQELASGKIIGHFDGRMEYGPRSLGNRSILADPRKSDALSRVNKKIKFREGWRPFAPIILEEEAPNYFEAPTKSPYMLLVSNLKSTFMSSEPTSDAKRILETASVVDQQAFVNSDFPAITHVNGTSRLQIIGPLATSRARKIIEAFFKITGCPMLLNTSFNVRGEPIVCTPSDAIECFLNTQMDILVLGSFMMEKTKQSEGLQALEGKKHFNAD